MMSRGDMSRGDRCGIFQRPILLAATIAASALLEVGMLMVVAPAHVHAAEIPQVNATVRQLATRFMCQCGCGLTLANCTHAQCGPRDMILNEIRRRVTAGETPEQITAALVARYGEVVLAAPPRRGFNLVAWWGPYAAILVGGVAIVLLGMLWTRRSPRQAPASGSALSDEERAWLDRELRRFDA